MTLQRKLSVVILALSAAMPMVLTAPAHAQPHAHHPSSSVQVDGFDVEQLRRVTPGSELEFLLTGTAGADVTVQIGGATDGLRLTEVQPGRYSGTYTVRSRDKLTADSLVTARVVKNGEALNVSLNESLVAGAPSPVAVETAAIEAFTVDAPDGIGRGDELNFSLNGAPGGKARVNVKGISKPIVLTETGRGVYEGSYTVRRQDRLRGELSATAFLVVNKREVSQRFERGQGDYRDVSRGESRDPREDSRAVARCANCGVVESVNLVEVEKQSPNVLGTIAGGVVGGLIGNQVGGGSGKKLATIAGAVGGAYAGNRVENSLSKVNEYRVVVRLDSGGTQTFAYAADPEVKVGALVRVENEALVRR